MKARVDEILNRWPAVGLAVGVVRNGSLEFFHGHGLADIASNTPITEDTVFRIGSITKTFTAIAVMQLWEQGLVDLDAPANDYLCAYKLVPAKPSFRPATVRHLLTHTAGRKEDMTTHFAPETFPIPASHLDLLTRPICGMLTTPARQPEGQPARGRPRQHRPLRPGPRRRGSPSTRSTPEPVVEDAGPADPAG